LRLGHSLDVGHWCLDHWEFNVLTIPPSQFRKNRRRPVRRPPSGPAALVLVSAVYDHFDPPNVVLGFDRAIDISGLVGSAIVVTDAPVNGWRYDATAGASLENPTTVKLLLSELVIITEGETLLNASASSGIVAPDDRGTWAGVTGLVLPWPPSAIVSVTHGSDGSRLIVGLNHPLVSHGDISQMLEVSSDGVSWAYPTTVIDDDPANLEMVMSEDVSSATQWRVPDAGVWHFAGGQVLGEPLTGSIE
jgi:hypothetical protein